MPRQTVSPQLSSSTVFASIRESGGHYNNPSFGYGGYCLPKDSRQLLADYGEIPQKLVGAIVAANQTRQDFITDRIEQLAFGYGQHGDGGPVVGIYRLTMKCGSDHFRNSSVLGVMERLMERGVGLVVYEPMLEVDEYLGARVISDLDDFKQASTIIVANRYDSSLENVGEKVYTRDLFNRD